MMEQAPANQVRRRPLPIALKLQYAVGGMVEGIVNNAIPTFLLFYLTAVAGLPGALAGAALAAGTIIDAVLDPWIGSASDNTKGRFGRRLPFMLAGLPLIALCFFFIFSLPQGWSEPVLFAWLTLLSVILRISLSLFGIPFQAVAAELTEDYTERSTLVALRWGMGLIAGLMTVVVGFSLFFAGENGLSQPGAYPLFGASLAVFIALVGLVGAGAVFRSLDLQHAAPPESSHHLGQVFKEMGEVFRNPSFRVLAGCGLLLLSALAIHGGLGIHAGTYFWRLEATQLQILPLMTLVGLLAGTPLAAPLTKYVGKRNVVVAGLFALVIAYVFPPVLRISGLLPFEGDSLVILLAANSFFAGALMSAAVIALNSMLADATDEHEHLFGTRREGLYFAAWLFASKAAAGVGTLAAGLILQFVKLPTGGQDGGLSVPLDQSTLIQFGLCYGVVPGGLALGALLCLAFYRLDAVKHAKILSELHARRGERQQAAMA